MAVATLVLGATLDPPRRSSGVADGGIGGWLPCEQDNAGGGSGLIGDIVVGIIGAFIGGWVSGLLGFGATYGLIGSIIIAFIGACLLLAVLRAVSRRGASRGWGQR